jgi:hypothetical protein
MSISDPNQPPEEDKKKPTSDVNKRPLFEPKRVIHLSKPLSDSSESETPSASILRPEPASASETKEQPESTPVDQSETPTENAKPEAIPTRGDRTVPQFSDKRINPGLRLRALLTASKIPPPKKLQNESNMPSKPERTTRINWGAAAGLSLIINAILVGALLMMTTKINQLKTTVNGLNDLMSGLYSNFTEMDKSSITTTLTVDTQVPIDFMLPIQQNTDVVLTQSVVIPNANIVINSGSITINSQARVTLPAGTNLPIALNIAVPIQFSVPVTLQIPVNIPLAQTQLHQSFTGIQNAVRTYYCTFDKNAQFPQGTYICEDHDNPTPIPGVP